MKYGDGVKWISGIGKERTGKYITGLKTRPGLVLIFGDDGRQHTIQIEKLRKVSAGPSRDAPISMGKGRVVDVPADQVPPWLSAFEFQSFKEHGLRPRRVVARNVTAMIYEGHLSGPREGLFPVFYSELSFIQGSERVISALRPKTI